ncbi:MAG: hypothetical protein LBR89_01555 [Holosporales bacterium]|jgi:hypothetical protein|nr:hypothetical protein [Holosporales bacterium]
MAYLFILLSLFLCSCSKYIETEADISVAGEYESQWIVAIDYDVQEYIGSYGTVIKHVQQSWLDEEKPIDPQKIRIRYLKEDPIFFKKIDEIKYERK